jgi:basic membrane protein A
MVRFPRFSTVIHSLFALTVAACGKGDKDRVDTSTTVADSTTNSVTNAASATFKVALLTSGPVSDQGWNGGAYQGLLRIRDSLGAQISNIQTRTPAEIEENFRQYGAQGYQLVIGHGFEFQDPALRVSPDFPKTTYVIASGGKTGANVSSIEFAFGEGAYLAGMVAGLTTKSNVIGIIGGVQIPPVVKAFEAFIQGAKAVNPRVQVLSAYIGNWDDVSAGKEQALAQIARRADRIFQNADNAGLGVFQAARERSRAGTAVRVFGSNADQNAIAPEVTLGSVVIDLPHAFLLVAREVNANTHSARLITLGAKDDVIKWVPNPALARELPANVTAQVDSANQAIKAGTLKPGAAQ